MRFKITTATKVIGIDKKIMATPSNPFYLDSARYIVTGGASGAILMDLESGLQVYCSATLATAATAIDAATSTTPQVTF
jgi:hypothetical protein